MTLWITVVVSVITGHITLLRCEENSNSCILFELSPLPPQKKPFLSRDIAETSVSLFSADCGLLI
jgi:hypothetical protein